MDLERPAWFERIGEWWDPVAGVHLARNVQPVGFTADGRLYVLCSNPPWSTQMRVLAPRLIVLLNEARPAGVPKVTGIVILKSAPLPDELTQHWADLVGADLADEVCPKYLSDWGQELDTEAMSAQARDLLARRAPVVLARLRAVLPDTTIVRLSESRLRPVSVVVVSSAEFSDRQALEDVLLDTWHDAAETVGPDHTLWLKHPGRTAADQMVEDWASQVARTGLPSCQLVNAFASELSTDGDGPDAVHGRDDYFTVPEPDLCLVFATREDEEIPLVDLARERGLAVRRYVQ